MKCRDSKNFWEWADGISIPSGVYDREDETSRIEVEELYRAFAIRKGEEDKNKEEEQYQRFKARIKEELVAENKIMFSEGPFKKFELSLKDKEV